MDAYILVTFGMADRYNQAGTVREEVCPFMLAGRLQPFTQPLHEKGTSPSENTSKNREEPATVGFARPKQ